MTTSTFKDLLNTHPDADVTFLLPNGDGIPVHAHITEVGRVDKTFLDCGRQVRRQTTCSLQAWVADDTNHRLPAGKLAAILDGAAEILGTDDPEVEVEYEDAVISQYPVEAATTAPGTLTFQLTTKHTDCLAKDICLPPAPDTAEATSCCSGTGCC